MKLVMDMMNAYALGIILVLLCMLMIMMLCMVHQIRKTNRSITEIREKVAGYLKTVLTEAMEDAGEEEKLCKQEELMRASIENKKKQQQEAVFNAVLKEIFP